ncbi:MAG: UDP-N-acetylmuramoyl-L-alanyl-D-glutamate--2,6-diaminopimelate ligase [Clostridia bacterium]|nr:UDP-N-acetylmuramoyl-L-alanyl-D-glutamate--2,6-diaminopimelate ligase [Clostridia bacterium]
MEKRLHSLGEYLVMFRKHNLITDTNVGVDELEKMVRYISFNSQDVKFNTIFVCKGEHFKEDYLWDAAGRGACAYISEKKYIPPEERKDTQIPYIIVNDIRKTMAYLTDFFYNQVSRELTLIGITGTKGKSTTAYFMKYILDDFEKHMKKPKTAIVSGIDNYDGVISEESHLTTPEAIELHKHFNNAAKSDIEYLTMEVSSQALKYDRVLCINYDVGCFLNIGEDHISDLEHPDFNDYFASKLRLFDQCSIACVNIDSDHSAEILAAAKERAPKVITFGTVSAGGNAQDKDAGSDAYEGNGIVKAAGEPDIFGYDIKVGSRDITFRVRSDSFDREFKITMHGLFNVSNALAAIAMSYALNIPLESIAEGLKKAHAAGRMEIFTSPETGLNVIVDYAHNKLSFESLFTSMMKEFPEKKISIVFGCPGRKALGRRRELGEIAGRYSNMVYITEEDAGEEPVLKISEEIQKHVEAQNCKCEIITDRREAIRRAIEDADEDTLVLITGKGRETRQKRGIQYIDTPSDVEYVKEFLHI